MKKININLVIVFLGIAAALGLGCSKSSPPTGAPQRVIIIVSGILGEGKQALKTEIASAALSFLPADSTVNVWSANGTMLGGCVVPYLPYDSVSERARKMTNFPSVIMGIDKIIAADDDITETLKKAENWCNGAPTTNKTTFLVLASGIRRAQADDRRWDMLSNGLVRVP